MTQIHAYLTFNGNCREAMYFYQRCLGGELSFQTVEGTPIASNILYVGSMQRVLHASLVKEGLVLMASEMIGVSGWKKGNNISLSLQTGKEKEIRKYYEQLSAGAQIIEPLKEQFWGAIFGALVDKYGITWIFNCDKKEDKYN